MLKNCNRSPSAKNNDKSDPIEYDACVQGPCIMPCGLDQAIDCFDFIGAIILITDHNNKLLSINRMARDKLGYSGNEIAGADWVDLLVHHNSRPALKEYLLNILSEKHGISEPIHSRLICKDAQELLVSWSITHLKDEAGNTAGLILSGSDITSLKVNDDESKNMKDALLSFLRSATYAVIFSDSSGIITFWNKTATSLFGYKEDEVVGKPITIITPKRFKKAHEGWDQIVSIGNSPMLGRIFEATGLRKDGTEFPIELTVSTVRSNGQTFHAALMNDISRRKMKERLISISKNKYRMIFQKSPLGIFHFDERGVITQCNEKFVRIVGAAHENVISTIINFNMLESFNDAAMIKCIKQVLSGIPARYEDDFASPFSDKVIPIKAEFSPVISDESKLLGGVCVVEDFTERKAAEVALSKYAQDLANANKELKSLDRMKDEFLSNLRHELKTPLIPIIGYSELMSDGALGELNDKQKDAVSKVLLSSDRLKRLIDSLLYVSVTEGGNVDYTFVPLLLNDVIDSAICDRSHELLSKGHIIERNIQDNIPFIEGDLDYLQDVFVNILDNAIKFTSPGGTIQISASKDNDFVHVKIEDNGIGIPKENMSKIFTRFYQADGSSTRNYGGNGLGLYICKKIIEAHKGSIYLESVEGEGTTVHIYLPAYSASEKYSK